MTSRTEDIPTLLARIPDRAIRELFSLEFILCCEQFDRFTTAMVLRLVRELEMTEALDRGSSASRITAEKGWVPRSEVPIGWFLRKLEEEGILEREEDTGEAIYRSRGPLPLADPDEPQARARAIDPGSMPPFEVVRAMAEHVPEFLRGEKTGEEILFAPNRLGLWFEYFSNSNLLYQINNRLGAEAVFRALPLSKSASVVELGGGSGSAALALFERLARDAAGSRIGRYVFTEIVPTFLRRAERAVKTSGFAPPVDFLKLDFDRDFEEQGVPAESADVVYAVNTVHIARDLAATLEQIRKTLVPGGVAVFSECVRPFPNQPIYVEFVFNFLENFTGVATDPATRPNHGFLTPADWGRAFAAAGFEDLQVLPDVEQLARHYDAFFVAAVSARRPR